MKGIPAVLPYGRQWIDEDDIREVVRVLRSDWLTTGPAVAELEKTFARTVGTRYAVAVSNGTAALHVAMMALRIGPTDEVIVPTMTFAASANCVVYQGGTPVFADVRPDTLLLDPQVVEAKISPRTKAVIAVDYAGHPCAYDELRSIADRHGLILIADACHSLGGSFKGSPVGSLADLSTFSFHPVKHITSGEGGIITTDDESLAKRMRMFRNHGITVDFRARAEEHTWFYEIAELGYNYRLTDIQCVLAMSQLKKLSPWVARRREIAKHYDETCEQLGYLEPLTVKPYVEHAYHLYVVRISEQSGLDRSSVFQQLRAAGIGVNVHYVPVHLHPFYRKNFHTGYGFCPVAEQAYERILSLPMFPKMTDDDVTRVCDTLAKISDQHAREIRDNS